MKKNNLLKLLGVALVVAIVATGLFYGLVVSRMSSNSGNGTMLIVATHALKPGTVLQASDVKQVPWLGGELPKSAYGKANDVIGSTVFDPIGEGEPVFSSHLASANSGGGSGVPEGMRAVSVHVTDSSGVLALLRAGQKVDVQVVVGRGGEKNDTAVRTALEDLTVLAVTTQIEQGSQGQNLPVVTVLAKPAEADVLAAADSGARVRMTLRNPLDQQTRGSGELTLTSVMHGSSKTGEKSASGKTPEKPRRLKGDAAGQGQN